MALHSVVAPERFLYQSKMEELVKTHIILFISCQPDKYDIHYKLAFCKGGYSEMLILQSAKELDNYVFVIKRACFTEVLVPGRFLFHTFYCW